MLGATKFQREQKAAPATRDQPTRGFRFTVTPTMRSASSSARPSIRCGPVPFGDVRVRCRIPLRVLRLSSGSSLRMATGADRIVRGIPVLCRRASSFPGALNAKPWVRNGGSRSSSWRQQSLVSREGVVDEGTHPISIVTAVPVSLTCPDASSPRWL